MKNKYEVFKRFKKFQVVTENETGNRIITLRSDIGGKYVSAKFESYLKEQDIKHELSVARCPEQNGVAERMNHPLIELVRTMLNHAIYQILIGLKQFLLQHIYDIDYQQLH